MITSLLDVKTGWVSLYDTPMQLGAYSICSIYPSKESLPKIDEGLILRVNNERCEPIRIQREELDEAKDLFLCALKLYKAGVKKNIIKPKGNEVYPLLFDDSEIFFPRVTSILKIIDRPQLNSWLVRESVRFTLNEMETHKRTPSQVLEMIDAKMFDPQLGALSQRDKRGSEGNDIHRVIHNYLVGIQTDMSKESSWVQTAYSYFLKWAKSVNLKLVNNLSETKVVSWEHYFAGTVDGIVTWEAANGVYSKGQE